MINYESSNASNKSKKTSFFNSFITLQIAFNQNYWGRWNPKVSHAVILNSPNKFVLFDGIFVYLRSILIHALFLILLAKKVADCKSVL